MATKAKPKRKRLVTPNTIYVATYKGSYGHDQEVIAPSEVSDRLSDGYEVFEFARGSRVTGVTVTLAKGQMIQAGAAHPISVDMDKVEAIRGLILDHLASKGVNTGYGIMGCLLAVGGLVSDEPLDVDQQAKFIQDAMNWTDLYFTGQGKQMN